MRLFVALEVPDESRRRIDRAVLPLRERFSRLRWTQPDSWHLTLAFLGEVDPAPIRLAPALVEAAETAPATIRLRVRAPGRFGARVLWLGTDDEPAGAVSQLGERLQDAAARAGIDVDRKPVRPHLTLARARGRDARVTAAMVDACPAVDVSWEASRAVLFRSHLGDGPARYEVVTSLAFGGGAPAEGPGDGSGS